MDFLAISRPIVIPAGFNEPRISLGVVVVNVDIFLMESAAIDFDGTAG